MVFVGRDTYTWGSGDCNMRGFIAAARQDIRMSLVRNDAPFRNLQFTEWKKSKFWDTVMRLLAGFYEIPNWKDLQERRRDDILRRFVWAETNSIEKWESSPSVKGADKGEWLKVKLASDRHLDSFSAISEVFRPHVSIVMGWGSAVPHNYWRDCSFVQRECLGDHVNYAFDETHSTHVFHTAHPNWYRSRDRKTKMIEAVLEKLKTLGGTEMNRS